MQAAVLWGASTARVVEAVLAEHSEEFTDRSKGCDCATIAMHEGHNCATIATWGAIAEQLRSRRRALRQSCPHTSFGHRLTHVAEGEFEEVDHI